MFIRELIEKANKSSNTEEVTQIRNKLIKFGIIGVIIGIVGNALCFMGFIIAVLNQFQDFSGSNLGLYENNYSINIFIIPLMIISALFIFFNYILGFGAFSIYGGVCLVVVQKTSDFIDTNIYCSSCGSAIVDSKFCTNCGKQAVTSKECNSCYCNNSLESKFCKQCGTQL